MTSLYVLSFLTHGRYDLSLFTHYQTITNEKDIDTASGKTLWRSYFGTKSGVTYSIDPLLKKVDWAFKLDNSMINTVNVIGRNTVVVASMDGKVSVLRAKQVDFIFAGLCQIAVLK